jgi:hypothetical protein
VAHVGGKELVEMFDSLPELGNNATIVKAFNRVGQMLVDADRISGDVDGVKGPEDAVSSAQDIMTNDKNPLHKAYHDKQDPRHAEATKAVSQYFELAHGTEPVLDGPTI